jgi:hypothetical protein
LPEGTFYSAQTRGDDLRTTLIDARNGTYALCVAATTTTVPTTTTAPTTTTIPVTTVPPPSSTTAPPPTSPSPPTSAAAVSASQATAAQAQARTLAVTGASPLSGGIAVALLLLGLTLLVISALSTERRSTR